MGFVPSGLRRSSCLGYTHIISLRDWLMHAGYILSYWNIVFRPYGTWVTPLFGFYLYLIATGLFNATIMLGLQFVPKGHKIGRNFKRTTQPSPVGTTFRLQYLINGIWVSSLRD